jgi:hypothetical protein
MSDNIFKKTITIRRVQGVGDVFWVYQKLSPLFDVINFVNCPLQTSSFI